MACEQPDPTPAEIEAGKVEVRESWRDHKKREKLGLSPVRHCQSVKSEDDTVPVADLIAAANDEE